MKKSVIFAISLSALLISCTSTPEARKETPHELIKSGRINEAKMQFQMPSDINGQDEDGNTVLHLSAANNDVDLVTFLCIRGANTEIKNFEGDTPLHVAIKNGAYDSAKMLVQMGANLFEKNAEKKTALDLGLKTDPIYYDYFITTKSGEIRDVDGQTIVHYFVLTQNLKGVEYCIKNGIPVSVMDNFGKTPLDVAFSMVESDTAVKIAAALIMGGAEPVETDFAYFQDAISSRNLNTRFDDGQTPLHMSAIYGHTAIAKYLIENNANLDVQDSSGATPLHEAVRYGRLDIAKMLLSVGANVNAKDNLGKTPVMVVIPQEKLVDTYRLLISYNADLAEKDSFGDTVIHTATMMHVPVHVLRLLASNGADINAKNKEGVTPFEIAVQYKDIASTEFFAVSGADIHSKDTRGNSPLLLALANGDELFERTVSIQNVQTQDSDGNTPLHVALLQDASLSKIRYIIRLTEDVNIRNSEGNSPLFLAIQKNRREVGEMLLEKNADIFSTNTNNQSPLRLALINGGDIQDWLITSKTIKSTDGSGNTALHYAAEWQLKKAIKSLVDKGAEPNAKNANGENPLFSAVKTNNPDIITLLVEKGTLIHERDNLGSTALHMAVRWDADKALEKLIKMKIDINAQNSSGKSALAEAALAGKTDLATILLENGADVNSSDVTGVTILMDAIRSQNAKVVKLLLKYNANSQIQEINGRNAYHEAAASGNLEIIKMIYKAGGNPLSRDKHGNTPFGQVLDKDTEIILAVLGNNVNITDSDGNSPIHIVVQNRCSVKLLNELIYLGYPIDSRNSDGFTPLSHAVEKGYAEIALKLLENGANPFQSIDKKGANAVTIALEKNNKKIISDIVKYAGSMTDIQGNTILHYAAKSSKADTVRDLLSYGLKKDVKNISGDTPYMVALRWKKKDNADLLK